MEPGTLLLANFNDQFAQYADSALPQHAGDLWQRAIALADRPGYLMVAPGMPSNLDDSQGIWNLPAAVVVPQPGAGELSADLRADSVAWDRVIQWSKAFPSIEVRAQIHSASAAEIREQLAASGVPLQTVPRVSAGAVRFWNSKIGGRDLLQSIPEVRRKLPPATIARSLAEAVAFVAGTRDSIGLVVKTDDGMGGAGIRLYYPGSRRPFERVFEDLSTLGATRGKNGKGAKLQLSAQGSFLVEEMLGQPGTQPSPTVDLWITLNGGIHCVGVADQILESGTRYVGSRYPSAADTKAIEACIHLGTLIAATLSNRGYIGAINVDFVVPQPGQAYVAEVNLRQSAPYDQLIANRAIVGAGPQGSFRCGESLPCSLCVESTSELRRALSERIAEGPGERILPLSVWVDPSGVRRATLLCMAPSSVRAEDIFASCLRNLHGA